MCTSEIRSAMYIIPIMSDIRGIITADFGYAVGESILVNERFHHIAIENSLEINPSLFPLLTFALPPPFSLSLSLISPLPLALRLPLALSCFRAFTCIRLFSLSTLSIVFCIAHPQASVHYRKYWISIMKYWMISDIRRAADIVRSQYVLTFLAVPTSGSRQRREIALPAVASSIINMPCWNSHLTEK